MEQKYNNTIEWLAGLIEGEGSFIIKKTGVSITCQMTDEDVIKNIKSVFGGAVYFNKKRKEHWKDSWKWQINGEDAYNLAEQLKPHMFGRRTHQVNKLLYQYENSPKKLQQHRTSRTILKVKELRESGLLHREIAEKLGVHRTFVSHILRGKYGA